MMELRGAGGEADTFGMDDPHGVSMRGSAKIFLHRVSGLSGAQGLEEL